jgi:PAS domain S-box-containing protein
MINELQKLRELTETLTGNGYLKDQAKEWEYALDAIPECIYIINNRFEIKFTNRTLAKKLGKRKEELFNKLCYVEIQGLEDDPSTDEFLDVEIMQSKPTLPNVYLSKLEGWFDITRSPIYSNVGQLLGFICVLQDISIKKKALEESLRRKDELEAIFDAAPIGIGLVEEGTRNILSVNNFLCSLLGYSEEELVGKSVRMLYATEEEYLRVGILKYIQIEKTGVGSLETQFLTKSGELLDIFLKTSKIKSGKSLVFTVTDITNRKRRDRTLKLNEERLESILEFTKREYFSQEEITKCALEEAVRLTDSEIGYIHFVDNEEGDVNLVLFSWSNEVSKNCVAKKVPHYPLDAAGCWADCIRIREPVIHNDYENLTYEDGKRGLPEGHIPLKRHMSVPIIGNGGNIVAVAGVGNKVHPYDDTDVRQLLLFMHSMWDILERKKAEDEIKKSRTYFECLVSSTSTGILIYRLEEDNLMLKHFNDAASTILTMHDLYINRSLEDLFPPLRGLSMVDEFKNVAKNGGVFKDLNFKYIYNNIESFFSVIAFQSDTNEVAVLFSDTTEQKKHYDEIKIYQDKFRIIFECSTDIIIIVRIDNRFIVDVNPAFERHTGYSREEVIGKDIKELNLWNDEEGHELLHKLLLNNSKVEDFPATLKLVSGEVVETRISSSITYIENVPHIVSMTRIYDKAANTGR